MLSFSTGANDKPPAFSTHRGAIVLSQASFYRRYGKRVFDLSIAFILLVLSSPILLLTALTLAIFQKGKVFFFQERPGKNEDIFKVFKFKSMTDETDAKGNLLPDDERKTVVGDLVRKLSIDELLQLVNVLKGDMSLIGPRPLLVDYLPHYNASQKRRHEVLPGITGLAQVKGRNALSWERRFRYDVFYVDHLSFLFDLLIIWWTVKKVLSSEDVDFESPVGADTYFRGTQRSSTSKSEEKK